jgi:hypothetical protein
MNGFHSEFNNVKHLEYLQFIRSNKRLSFFAFIKKLFKALCFSR